MADCDTGTSPDAPLTAKVADQVRETAHLELEAEAERLASERRERSLEHRKEAERQVAAAHGGHPATWAGRRRAAHDAPVHRPPFLRTLVLIAGGLALLTGLFHKRG